MDFYLIILGLTLAIIGTVRSVVSQTPTTQRSTSAPLQMWRKEDVPNPQIDVWDCGRGGRRSWVCDPNRIITSDAANRIDDVIEDLRLSTGGCRCLDDDDCPRDPSYGGYQAAVAILNKIRLPPNPTSKEKRKQAKDYADYLRDDSWEFGDCNDDLVILISDVDRIVYTRSGDAMTHLLDEKCVDSIFAENKQYFSDGDYAEGTMRLLEEYKAVLRKDRKCGPNSTTTYIVVGVLVGGGIIFVIAVVVCKRMGHCQGFCEGSSGGGGGGGGGHHSDDHHHHDHHDHHDHHHSRSNSVSSQSSGGGGGEF